MSIQKEQFDDEKWLNFHNHWSKIKGNYHFDVYQNDDKWVWKLRLSNVGIDYTFIDKGVAKTLNEAIKLCDSAFINHVKHFQK
jgi:hypothetical protein